MRKDPEKRQMGKEKRKKRLTAIVSICVSVAIVIAAIAGTIAYTMTNQLPQDEKQLSARAVSYTHLTLPTICSV